MNARLILSISGNGDFSVSLRGQGRTRQRLLRAYEESIESFLPIMKQKVKNTLIRNLGGGGENPDPYIN